MLLPVTQCYRRCMFNRPDSGYHYQVKESKNAMLGLGNRIRKARAQAGLSQDKLAELVGVSRSALARWESGDNEPTLYNLSRLAIVLHVSCDYLLCIDAGNIRKNSLAPLSPEAEAALEKFIAEIRKETKK